MKETPQSTYNQVKDFEDIRTRNSGAAFTARMKNGNVVVDQEEILNAFDAKPSGNNEDMIDVSTNGDPQVSTPDEAKAVLKFWPRGLVKAMLDFA